VPPFETGALPAKAKKPSQDGFFVGKRGRAAALFVPNAAGESESPRDAGRSMPKITSQRLTSLGRFVFWRKEWL
jgi:hypothetical protein